MNTYLQEAFNQVLKDAKQCETWYVTLMESVPFYGGPEEGGWWGNDTYIVAYQEFPSEEKANEAAEQIKKLAKELEREAGRGFGRQCQVQLEWLEARMLDSDYLPEPDGPNKYYVVVSQDLPEETRGCRHYE